MPQAIWPVAKSLTNRDGPRAPTAIHGPLGLKYYPVDKANAIADCLENSSHRMTCVTKTMNGGRRLESKLCPKLHIVTPPPPPERIRPCDLQKLLNSLKLKKACGIDDIPNECLRSLPRRPLVHLTHLIKTWMYVSG
jgi:hypothetical protein